MAVYKILGMDPSFRNWGLAEGLYDTDKKKLFIHRSDVITSLPKKESIYEKALSNIRTSNNIRQKVLTFAEDAHYVFVEVPYFSQNHSGAISLGACLGILGSLGINFIPISPDEVKHATIGHSTAKKGEIYSRAVELYPNAGWKLRGGKIVAKYAEHTADAIGAIEAGISKLNL